VLKYILSYTKSHWDFGDYPIKILYEKRPFVNGKQWYANLENWNGMITSASTKEEVIKRLKVDFESYKTNNSKLPRPGTRVRIGFASTKEIDKYKDISKDYLHNVLASDILGTTITFISDFSTLHGYVNFAKTDPEKFKNELIKRTLDIYGLDITDLYDKPIYKIFERIKTSKELRLKNM
jgi:predicted nucleotide-binding protein (sugar kinase/HSP70/actin superfamily)